MDKDASGRITAVTWAGGRIEPAEFEDFVFQARTPEAAGKIAFKAYQTYLSGDTVEWVDAEGAARPAAIVEVKAVLLGTRVASPPNSGVNLDAIAEVEADRLEHPERDAGGEHVRRGQHAGVFGRSAALLAPEAGDVTVSPWSLGARALAAGRGFATDP